MGFGGLPFNPSSPGPIGNTTPDSVALTTLTANANNTGAKLLVGGLYPGAATAISGLWGLAAPSVPNAVNYGIIFIPGSGQTFINATTQISLLISGTEVFNITNGVMAMTAGAQFQLGNNATTGLVAGVLAAQTNASITIRDGTGQTYRIPCII